MCISLQSKTKKISNFTIWISFTSLLLSNPLLSNTFTYAEHRPLNIQAIKINFLWSEFFLGLFRGHIYHNYSAWSRRTKETKECCIHGASPFVVRQCCLDVALYSSAGLKAHFQIPVAWETSRVVGGKGVTTLTGDRVIRHRYLRRACRRPHQTRIAWRRVCLSHNPWHAPCIPNIHKEA